MYISWLVDLNVSGKGECLNTPCRRYFRTMKRIYSLSMRCYILCIQPSWCLIGNGMLQVQMINEQPPCRIRNLHRPAISKYRSQSEVQDSLDWSIGDSVKNWVVLELRNPGNLPYPRKWSTGGVIWDGAFCFKPMRLGWAVSLSQSGQSRRQPSDTMLI